MSFSLAVMICCMACSLPPGAGRSLVSQSNGSKQRQHDQQVQMSLVIGQRLVIGYAVNACCMNACLLQQQAQSYTAGFACDEGFDALLGLLVERVGIRPRTGEGQDDSWCCRYGCDLAHRHPHLSSGQVACPEPL